MTTPVPLHLVHDAFEARAASFRAAGVLADAELLVVDVVAERFAETCPDVLLALALAVRAPRVGHVGVDLREVAAQVDDEQAPPPAAAAADPAAAPVAPDWPADPVAWERRALASALVGRPADREGGPRPFVVQPLEGGHALLMTRRMWREQERLADGLRALAAAAPARAVAPAAVERGVADLGLDGQGAAAVRVAARSGLTVVTGGPGTGKTWSIKRLLALLLQVHPDELRIELAAPTGKAAVRMQEALAEGLEALPTTAAVRERLQRLQPRTLHKLLGMRPDGTSRHGRERPLDADVIVVDEVSMVDLALMRRLVESVPPGARLVLLGDRDQLASVEAGTVLSDIVSGAVTGESGGASDGASGGASDAPLASAIVPFTVSHRFRDAPSVAGVARCLQRRDDRELPRAVRLMTRAETLPEDPHGLTWLGSTPAGRPAEAQLTELAAPYLAADGFAGQLAVELAAHGPGSAELWRPALQRALLDAFGCYRVLAVHRRGPLGVAGLERELAARVRGALTAAVRARRERLGTGPAELPTRAGHWLGRPLLVTENAYDVGLMNGDTGLVLPGARGLVAVFPVVRDDGARATKEVDLARLPPHQGALVMTVHKSQGSQFRRVALVLAGRRSPIQTRELVYTAVTRASHQLAWLGDPGELEAALVRRVRRASGLAELLWAGSSVLHRPRAPSGSRWLGSEG
jgi:exodeoxyribonuclease V alpha subunit